VLAAADDRRTLAITFFSGVSPRAQASRLTPPQHVRTALWCAQWVHPLVCAPDCPRVADVVERVHGYLATGALPDGKSVAGCPALLTYPGELSNAAAQVVDEAELAASAALNKSWPGKHSGAAAAHAARIATLVEGVAGAVEFCLALAQQVGLKP
jgi:hypothetical protein